MPKGFFTGAFAGLPSILVCHQPMMPIPPLEEHLSGTLDASSAHTVSQALIKAGLAEPIQDLLYELQATSGKVAQAAIEALPDVLRRCEPATIIPWLDVGIGFAQTAGAMALKYIRESPLILGIMDTAAVRQQTLTLILELADAHSEHAPHCAFELFRKIPELLLAVPHSELHRWAEIGMELADTDFILGIEFLKESPSIARALSADEVRPWVQFGTKLMTHNTLGKPDYVGTLEFFRSSPSILREIPEPELRIKIIALGATLADRFPKEAIEFLAESPQLLNKLPSPAWRLKTLQYAALLADRDGEATIAYMRRCPDFLSMAGGTEETSLAFQKWFGAGIEILDYSPEGGRAYFSLETRQALASLEQALCGISLKDVIRSLTLFGQMISGEPITIQPDSARPSLLNPLSLESGHSSPPPSTSPVHGEGQEVRHTIYLPDMVNQYPSRAENLRVYTVMTAHELGHLEFGTYRLNRTKLQQLLLQARTRYGVTDPLEPPLPTLTDLFECYPHKGVMRDLWMVLEDARVEHQLQTEYPGLRHDLETLAQEAVRTRSLLHGMTAREMIMDALLLRLSTHDPTSVAIQAELRPVIERSWQEAQKVQQTECTADDVLLVADRIYQIIDEMVGNFHAESSPSSEELSGNSPHDIGTGPRAAEETSGEYRPVTNFAYRGAMDPDWVESPLTEDQEEKAPENQPQHEPQTKTVLSDDEMERAEDPSMAFHQPQSVGHVSLASPTQSLSPSDTTSHHETELFYDEWDSTIQDYRTNWCRVVERLGAEGPGEFVQTTLAARGPEIRLLRRYFESIRPTALRRFHGQEDGEEVDWDALIQRIVDRRSGGEASDRVYIRRDRRERQVAVAFLIDMSGSTGRQVEAGKQRVIDVEKESLVVMSEALEAIGDSYAMYGYSGEGRGKVDFIVLKHFDDRQMFRAGQRIEAVTPLRQNRDGAAIRHTVHKLLGCPARHRLFILLSDGKPLDAGYADEYALEDTKMALREARLSGVRPFCLTVDRNANDYLKRMYGEVGFIILDNLTTLPERLPRVYQRLTV